MKADLYNHEERWKNWKDYHSKNNIDGLTKTTSDLIKQYLTDMENGDNVAIRNKRGGRSKSRLNKIAYTITWVCQRLRADYKITDITKTESKQLSKLFRRMREGDILTRKGTPFKATSDYVKVIKAFWHWYQKINRKKGNYNIEDITEDLDAKYDEKPTWVYLDEKQIDKFMSRCRGYYKPLIAFMMCSGCRPTEAFSLLVEDITEDKGDVYCNIRNEISKGGKCGRKIKLLLCGKELLDYIKDNELKPEDQLFFQSSTVTNRYMGELCGELFGDKNSTAGSNYKTLSLYDWRHNSCCYWVQRYKTNANLMYRFGWKSEKYIHYYSEFLGLKDNISQEDLFVDITKTELEKKVAKLQAQLKPIMEWREEAKAEAKKMAKEQIEELIKNQKETFSSFSEKLKPSS